MVTLKSFLEEKEVTAYGVDKQAVLYTKIFFSHVASPRSGITCETMGLYIFA
jgi:hypothetical protein